MIEAAALERVVNLAGAVRRDDDDRRMLRLDRAELRDGDLEVGQHLQKKGLEGLVRAVELVDQENRRSGGVGLKGLQERPLHQIAFREQIALERVAVHCSAGLGKPDGHHLPGIVPLVDGRGDIEAFVALQADEAASERSREHFRDLRLADAGFSFEKERASELQREKEHRRERAVGDIAGALQKSQCAVDGTGLVGHGLCCSIG